MDKAKQVRTREGWFGSNIMGEFMKLLKNVRLKFWALKKQFHRQNQIDEGASLPSLHLRRLNCQGHKISSKAWSHITFKDTIVICSPVKLKGLIGHKLMVVFSRLLPPSWSKNGRWTWSWSLAKTLFTGDMVQDILLQLKRICWKKSLVEVPRNEPKSNPRIPQVIEIWSNMLLLVQ